MTERLQQLLTTSLVLSEQFQTTLKSTNFSASNEGQQQPLANPPNPLKLLSDSSKTLRSHVTKLSLLAITAPFTPSAISTVLSAVNDTALPSLVTAALLITPDEYTTAYSSEARVLVRTALKEYSSLAEEVQKVTKREEKSELPKEEKDAITSQTGRAWDVCDEITELVEKGVAGFVARRVEEWRDLIKDAISELEEWDPENQNDDLDDFDFGDEKNGVDKDLEEDGEDGEDDQNTAALQTHKKNTLRLLKPIAQIYPAIISNRLKKGDLVIDATSSQKDVVTKLNSLIAELQAIPGHVDEVAGSLYEGNLGGLSVHLRRARKSAERAVALVAYPWNDSEEDKFTTWSATWMKVVEGVVNESKAQ
ncbi:hypothetical protein VTN31DRAFT_4125 [Thermomyces dupontii]|uniref:uncharacterized protein n=1 Tax=Talaromyces thermophilus TaxID=28565 RepID=UPI0037428861